MGRLFACEQIFHPHQVRSIIFIEIDIQGTPFIPSLYVIKTVHCRCKKKTNLWGNSTENIEWNYE